MREQGIGSYYRLSPKKRLDMIVLNFDCFPAIIRDYELELEDWVIVCRSAARQESLVELGVRVQSGNFSSSPTDSIVIERMQVEEMIKTGRIAAIDRDSYYYDELLRWLKEIRLMKHEYNRVKVRFGVLRKGERAVFERYIARLDRTAELSKELLISQNSVRKKMYRIKKKLYKGFVETLGSYTDETIVFYDEV